MSAEVSAQLNALSVVPAVPAIIGVVRVSTQEQQFDTQVSAIQAYCNSNFPGRPMTLVSYKGSAYSDEAANRLPIWEAIGDQKDSHLIVFDESRLARNMTAGGRLIDKVKANRITIHVVGVQDPYVVNTSDAFSRLLRGILRAKEEADTISERSRNYAAERKRKREEEERTNPTPPYAEDSQLVLLQVMLHGTRSITLFNNMVNRASPYGETDDKMGGVTHRLMNTDGTPVEAIVSGETFADLSQILGFFNDWRIFRTGTTRKKWTKQSLAKVIAHFFGKSSLSIVCDERMVQYFFPDVNIDDEEDEEDEEKDEHPTSKRRLF